MNLVWSTFYGNEKWFNCKQERLKGRVNDSAIWVNGTGISLKQTVFKMLILGKFEGMMVRDKFCRQIGSLGTQFFFYALTNKQKKVEAKGI